EPAVGRGDDRRAGAGAQRRGGGTAGAGPRGARVRQRRGHGPRAGTGRRAHPRPGGRRGDGGARRGQAGRVHPHRPFPRHPAHGQDPGRAGHRARAGGPRDRAGVRAARVAGDRDHGDQRQDDGHRARRAHPARGGPERGGGRQHRHGAERAGPARAAAGDRGGGGVVVPAGDDRPLRPRDRGADQPGAGPPGLVPGPGSVLRGQEEPLPQRHPRQPLGAERRGRARPHPAGRRPGRALLLPRGLAAGSGGARRVPGPRGVADAAHGRRDPGSARPRLRDAHPGPPQCGQRPGRRARRTARRGRSGGHRARAEDVRGPLAPPAAGGREGRGALDQRLQGHQHRVDAGGGAGDEPAGGAAAGRAPQGRALHRAPSRPGRQRARRGGVRRGRGDRRKGPGGARPGGARGRALRGGDPPGAGHRATRRRHPPVPRLQQLRHVPQLRRAGPALRRARRGGPQV
ncbi:MAG: UDP-N-acetylmuramoylalanine--D-glutamate ligase, partial [uncultured Gemmatimonadetes bacterium]